MSSEDANSGFFLLGGAALLEAALHADALASTRAISIAIAKRMTSPVGRSRLVQERNHAWPFCGAWGAICRGYLPRKPRLWQNQVISRPVEQGCPMRRAILTAAV